MYRVYTKMIAARSLEDLSHPALSFILPSGSSQGCENLT